MASSMFHPGNPGGPGRPKGSRNALSESFLSALHRDFQEHGAAAIEAARIESPLGYCKMVASLLPQKVEVAHGTAQMSDTELLAIINGMVEDPDPAPGEVAPAGSLTARKPH